MSHKPVTIYWSGQIYCVTNRSLHRHRLAVSSHSDDVFTMWLYHLLTFLRNLNIFVHLQVSKFVFGQENFYHENTLRPNFLIVEPRIASEWKCCTSYTVDSCKIASILPNRIYFKAINWEENQTSACRPHCVMILSSVYAVLGQP